MKTYKKILIIVLAVICYCIVMYLGFKIEGNINKSKQASSNIYITNDSESYSWDMERKFNISEAIDKYDIVIMAIEKYYQDHTKYPLVLEVLAPEYLEEVPGIYIRHGSKLYYSVTERYLNLVGPPFSFKVSGNYPGLAFMHGWSLYYCPIEFDGCNAELVGVKRLDNNWIWHHSSW